MRYMLDTDICIYAMRNRPLEVRIKLKEFAGEVCISTITLGELAFGAEKSERPIENRAIYEQFVANLTVLAFSKEAAAHYGQIRAALARIGRPCGIHDMLIGGHARSEGLTVVTNNVREFTRMPGLRVENWVA
jgi:tRNA(fMet)-specific endonuclease VapC